MGNKKNSKKMLTKIRIRLTDPGIPDSYVCEVLENSLDSENECTSLENITLENVLRPIQDVKIKNYFEVLMSNECRKNSRTHSVLENKKIFQEKMIIKNTDNKDDVKIKKTDSHCKQLRQNDSSDDETLFQIKKKCKLFNSSSVIENINCDDVLNKSEIIKETEKIFDSPKETRSEFILKKSQNTNILNYFFNNVNNKEEQIMKLNQNSFELNHFKDKQSKLVNVDKENSKTNIPSLKLAPLFIKKEKKVIDPEVQKARIDFLHKKLLPVKNLKTNKNIEFFEDFSCALHVQQRDDSIYWLKRNILLPLNLIPHLETDYDNVNNKTFRLNILTNKTVNIAEIDSKEQISDTIEKSIDSLQKLKSKYKHLNLDIVIENFKLKKDKFTQLTCNLDISKLTEKKSDSDKNFKDNLGYEMFNTLWIDKYKPSSSDILENGNTVKKLKTWLQSWKAFDEELKSINCYAKKKKEETDDSESDCFVNSDEETHGLKAPCNICILSGPNGCGKTALVFALAEELEFNVVEMNSSCKRSGKNVLAYFQEATQSHKVHGVSLPLVKSIEKNHLKKKRKKQRLKEFSVNEKSMEEVKNSKISLLLIEDADVVFEEKDDGFYSAIASLVQTSKRPFIFILNDSNCTLMDNLKTEKSLLLKMKYPSFYKSCAILDIMSVLEKKPTNKKLIEFIVQRNNFDLRKSLLDLQIWSGIKKEKLNFNRSFDVEGFWWGSFNFLHGQNLKCFNKYSGVKRKKQNRLVDFTDDDSNDEMEVKKFKQSFENKNCSTFNSEFSKSKPNLRFYFEVLDTMSIIDLLDPVNGGRLIPNKFYIIKDSLSLDEKAEDSNLIHEEVKKDLIEELITLSTKVFAEEYYIIKNSEIKLEMEFPSWEEIRWRNSQEDARHELSALLPLTNGTDNRSSHLDYLPILRNICRTEKNRLIVNSKRKNRFSHYFDSSLKLTEKNLEINQKVFNC